MYKLGDIELYYFTLKKIQKNTSVFPSVLYQYLKDYSKSY